MLAYQKDCFRVNIGFKVWDRIEFRLGLEAGEYFISMNALMKVEVQGCARVYVHVGVCICVCECKHDCEDLLAEVISGKIQSFELGAFPVTGSW